MSINNDFHQLETIYKTLINTNDGSDCIVVTDIDAHYAQAIGAGAEIIIDIQDDKCGGRSYLCRDLQGYTWSFSSYNPQNRRFWIKPIY